MSNRKKSGDYFENRHFINFDYLMVNVPSAMSLPDLRS